MTVKQKILQSAYAFGALATLCVALCGSCIAFGSLAAQTLAEAPGETTATVGLIAAPGPTGQGYDAGVEIMMSPGSHTYWKAPGEAGVPPAFAFNGSENVSAATILFPVPNRITEDGLEAFGYTDTVVFPVRVTPADPAKPSILHADVTYAVCNKICLPAHGTATLTLAPNAKGKDEPTATNQAARLVETAFSLVPKPATGEQRAMLSLARVATTGHGDDKSAIHEVAKPSWTLEWHGPAPIEDIFAEAPEGFFFTTKKIGEATWSLVAEQSVGLVSAKAIPVSLTLRQKTGGLVIMETLDAATPIQ